MVIDKEYLELEALYRKLFSDTKNLFPQEWYYVLEYEFKKKILRECLLNHILIIDSSYYYDFRLLALNN